MPKEKKQLTHFKSVVEAFRLEGYDDKEEEIIDLVRELCLLVCAKRLARRPCPKGQAGRSLSFGRLRQKNRSAIFSLRLRYLK